MSVCLSVTLLGNGQARLVVSTVVPLVHEPLDESKWLNVYPTPSLSPSLALPLLETPISGALLKSIDLPDELVNLICRLVSNVVAHLSTALSRLLDAYFSLIFVSLSHLLPCCLFLTAFFYRSVPFKPSKLELPEFRCQLTSAICLQSC